MKYSFLSKLYRSFIIIVTLYIIDAHSSDDYASIKSLLNEKKWSEAIPSLEVLLESAPNSNLIRQDLSLAYLRSNNRVKSYQLLLKGKLLKQAQVVAQSFQTEEGLRLYEEGFILLNQNKIKQSLEKFEKSFVIEKDHLDILIRLLECKILLGDRTDAFKWLSRIKEVYGFNDESLFFKTAYELKFEENLPTEFPSFSKFNNLSVVLLKFDFYKKMKKKDEAIYEIKKWTEKNNPSPLLQLFESLIKAELIKDIGEKPLLFKSLTDHLNTLDKTPESYQLNLSEVGRRLYAPELIKILLKNALDNLNKQTSD